MSQIINLSQGGGGPTPGVEVLTLTGDLGGPVGPDLLGNIDVIAGNATNNSGSSVLILGDPGTNTLRLDVTDVNQNVMIGQATGNLAISGNSNTALGFNAAGVITSGTHNTIIGRAAFGNNATGNRNVAIGALAMVFNTGSSSCVAIGDSALFESAGSSNIAIGDSAFGSGGSGPGSFNIAIGNTAGSNSNTQTENSNIYLNSFGAVESNTLRVGNASGAGNQELSRAFISGIYGVTPPGTIANVIIDNFGQLGTSATPVGAGAYAQVYNVSTAAYNPGDLVTFDSNGPIFGFTHVLGSNTITCDTSGLYLITWIFGVDDTGNATVLQNGVAVANISFQVDTNAGQAVGNGLINLTAGDTVQLRYDGTLVGLVLPVNAGLVNASFTLTQVLPSASSGGGGIQTLEGDLGGPITPDAGGNLQVIAGNATNNSGSSVIIVGDPGINTLRLDVTDVNGSTLIGLNAGNGLATGLSNTGLGATALSSLTTGENNVAVGNLALASSTTGGFNTAVGKGALELNTGSYNNAIGVNTLRNGTSDSNVGFGFQALTNLVSGLGNLSFGHNSSLSYTGGESSNIILGVNNFGTAGESNTLRIGNGTGAGVGNLSSAFIQGIAGVVPPGTLNMVTIDTGTGQLGSQAIPGGGSGITSVLTAAATPQFSLVGTTSTLSFNLSNLALGSSMPALTSGAANTGFGQTVFASVTSGNSNASFGTLSSSSITTALSNSAFGSTALQNLTTGQGNSVFGFSSGSAYTGNETGNILINNPGVAGESNTLRIGTSAAVPQQITRAFIHGIFGATVGVSGIPVVVDNANQLGTVVSSARFKYDIKDLAATDVLKLRPVSFKYKKTNEEAIGLIAEEVEKVMPSLVAYDKSNDAIAVKYNDLPVLLLAEIQKLQQRIKQLEDKLR